MNLILGLLLTLSLSACGSNQGASGSSGPITNNNPLANMSCADIWSMYVKGHPQGQYAEYESVTTRAGQHFSTRIEKVTITDSDDSKVVQSIESQGQTSSSTVTKEDFIKGCDTSAVGASPVVYETITVRAGTFNCYKSPFSGESSSNGQIIAKTNGEMWMSVDRFLFEVKSVATTVSTYNGKTETIVTTKELVLLR